MKHHILCLFASILITSNPLWSMAPTMQEVEARLKKIADESKLRLQQLDAESARAVKQANDLIQQSLQNVQERTRATLSYYEQPYYEGVRKALQGQLIVSDLEPIMLNNPNLIWNAAGDRILMTSWIPEIPYTRYYEPSLKSPSGQFTTDATFAFLSWVTYVPQLKNFMINYINQGTDIQTTPLQVRVAQVLGLPRPPENQKRYIVEMWVRPEDLVRPCGEQVREEQPALKCEIIDVQPQQKLVDVPLAKTSTKKGYEVWIEGKANEFYRSSYFFPWTKLSYTYDWGPGSEAKGHRGLDEFIIKPGSTVILHSATLTDQYPQLSTPTSGTVVT